jgi:hypothetical protein
MHFEKNNDYLQTDSGARFPMQRRNGLFEIVAETLPGRRAFSAGAAKRRPRTAQASRAGASTPEPVPEKGKAKVEGTVTEAGSSEPIREGKRKAENEGGKSQGAQEEKQAKRRPRKAHTATARAELDKATRKDPAVHGRVMFRGSTTHHNQRAKSHQAERPAAQRSTREDERWAADLIGPITPPGLRGERYVLSSIDDFSGRPENVPLKRKADAYLGLKKIFLRRGVRPALLRTDNGGEFKGRWLSVLYEERVRPELCCAWQPETNGKIERWNGTATRMVRASCANFPRLWPYAYEYAAQLHAWLQKATAGEIVQLKRVFGELVWYSLGGHKTKMEPRSSSNTSRSNSKTR